MKFLKRLLAGLRDSTNVKRALRGFGITFATLFVPGLLGWLHLVTVWASSAGGTAFPDAHGLVWLAVSATVAGLVGLVNLVVNALETATGKGFLRTVPATAVTDTVTNRPDLSLTEMPAIHVDPSKADPNPFE